MFRALTFHKARRIEAALRLFFSRSLKEIVFLDTHKQQQQKKKENKTAELHCLVFLSSFLVFVSVRFFTPTLLAYTFFFFCFQVYA